MKKYKFTVDLFSHAIPNIEKYITNKITKKFDNVLEIGSYEGKSACYWLENLMEDNASLTCIDSWEDKLCQILFTYNINLVKSDNQSVKSIKGYAKNVLPVLLNDPPLRKYDFIYVDGDHREEAVYSDLCLSFNMCKANGLILCDDYLLLQTQEATADGANCKAGIDKFIEEYKDKIEIIFSDYQILLKRIN